MHRVGAIVRHRDGRRGVIADAWPRCPRPGWEERGPADEPWYRVLVHESDRSELIPDTDLEPDPDGLAIDHPDVALLFDRFADGRYRPVGAWPPQVMGVGAVASVVVGLIVGKLMGVGIAMSLAVLAPATAALLALAWHLHRRRGTDEARAVVDLADPVFGPLEREPGRDWEGTISLPGYEDVVVRIDAPDGGPTDEQRAWFARLRSEWEPQAAAIVEAAREVVPDESLTLATIQLGATEPRSAVSWSVQFVAADRDAFVDLEGWRVVGVSAD